LKFVGVILMQYIGLYWLSNIGNYWTNVIANIGTVKGCFPGYRDISHYIRSVVFSGVYAGIRRMHAQLLVF
jgi:hypothetical protein